MSDLVFGALFGIVIMIPILMINSWFWRQRWENEKDYSTKLVELFEQNHPFKVVPTTKYNKEKEQ